MSALRRQAHEHVAAIWEANAYARMYASHVDSEHARLFAESEVARLRECLARCGALALKFSDMTHNDECDASGCDNEDCQCPNSMDGTTIRHQTECSCGVWATRDIAAMADAALAIGQSQGHPECPCSSSVEEPGPHIAACPYTDESYESAPSYSTLLTGDSDV